MIDDEGAGLDLMAEVRNHLAVHLDVHSDLGPTQARNRRGGCIRRIEALQAGNIGRELQNLSVVDFVDHAHILLS